MLDIIPSVYVIVLNWNLPIDTNRCVRSIISSDYNNLKVVIVDNASLPELYNQLEIKYENVYLISNNVNMGFAEGCNIGIKYAVMKNADYILLVNNDTVIHNTMVSQMISVAKIDNTIGIVGPLIFYTNPPHKIWFSGNHFLGKLYIVRLGQQLYNIRNVTEDVDFISGCGMLISRTVIEKVGHLASGYFMYYEDLDYCLRVKKNNFRIICATRAYMWHHVSVSTGGPNSPKKQYYQIKSSLQFYKKNTQGVWYLINVIFRIYNVIKTIIKNLFSGKLTLNAGIYYFRGIYDYIKGE